MMELLAAPCAHLSLRGHVPKGNATLCTPPDLLRNPRGGRGAGKETGELGAAGGSPAIHVRVSPLPGEGFPTRLGPEELLVLKDALASGGDAGSGPLQHGGWVGVTGAGDSEGLSGIPLFPGVETGSR